MISGVKGKEEFLKYISSILYSRITSFSMSSRYIISFGSNFMLLEADQIIINSFRRWFIASLSHAWCFLILNVIPREGSNDLGWSSGSITTGLS